MRVILNVFAIVFVTVFGANVRAAEEDDSSLGLPEEYAKHYVIASGTISPDKKCAVIIPKADPEDEFPEGKDYLVALQPFATIRALDTKSPYFVGESHGGISAEWSEDSSVALVTLDSKWGPGDVFLLELREGKLTRMTNLLAKAHDLLLPDYRKAKPKPEPYNDLFDFIFESEDPVCRLEGTARVKVNGDATTDPKGVANHRWRAHVSATWDVAQGKFTDQKITRVGNRR